MVVDARGHGGCVVLWRGGWTMGAGCKFVNRGNASRLNTCSKTLSHDGLNLVSGTSRWSFVSDAISKSTADVKDTRLHFRFGLLVTQPNWT